MGRRSPSLSAASWLVIALATVQFARWFQPSEPLLVDIITHTRDGHGRHRMSDGGVYHSLFPISTIAMLPATLTIVVVFRVVGAWLALALSLAAAALCPLCVLLWVNGAPDLLLQGSQVLFALGFASTMVVSAITLAAVAPAHVQPAASLNRCVMLLATVSSSLLGQLLSHRGVTTLRISVASTSFALVGAVVVGVVHTVATRRRAPSPHELALLQPSERWSDAGAVVPVVVSSGTNDDVDSPCSDDSSKPPPSLVSDVLASLRVPGVALWMGLGASVLAVHTVVITNWQSLFQSRTSTKDNGVTYAAAYLFSAAVSWLPAVSRRVGGAAIARTAALVCVCGGAVLVLARSTSLPLSAVMLVLYHGASEGVLSMTDARLVTCLRATSPGVCARQGDIVAGGGVKGDDAHTTGGAAAAHTEAARGTGVDALDGMKMKSHTHSNVSTAQQRMHRRVSLVVASSAIVSMALQDVLQLAVGPRGADLGVSAIFAVLGVTLVLLGVTFAAVASAVLASTTPHV
jgi:hypothetical protein